MRNWNFKLSPLNAIPGTSFEPTYEELKPSTSVSNVQAPVSFEPTYEELKHLSCSIALCASASFWAYLWGIETVIV